MKIYCSRCSKALKVNRVVQMGREVECYYAPCECVAEASEKLQIITNKTLELIAEYGSSVYGQKDEE